MTNRLREAIENKEFVVTCEVIPGRGAAEPAQVKEFEEACQIWDTGRVHGISITDNPSGNPAHLAESFGRDFFERGITPLIHFTCKDRNRNQIQSQLYALQRQGLENLLLMSGDYQNTGWAGRARPVFDLDPVQALALVSQMNEGLAYPTAKDGQHELGGQREQPASFFAGAVVNPFKYTEGETLTQYWKLEKKILSGARFIITQLGYDARKMEELLIYLRKRGYTTPVIANVFLLGKTMGSLMRRGGIAGCYISDELMAVLERESTAADKGRAPRLERAAKMVAIARGMGFAGVHIGGFGITAEAFCEVLDRAEQLTDDWQVHARELSYGAPQGYYYYAPTSATPPTSASATPSPTETPRTEVVRTRKLMRVYGLSRLFHRLALTRDKGLYGILRRVMERRERKKGLHRRHGLEHLGKMVLYGCMDCGDCGLEAAIYTCPMTQCPKCQRNGPCGGSSEGWCEVYPGERYCIYFKAYHRLKKYNELEKLDRFITPPNNWEFFETSGWSNYTHERDNASKRIYLPPPGKRESKEREDVRNDYHR
jgi:methylenetetrahydrofolate reductase (NADPH)